MSNRWRAAGGYALLAVPVLWFLRGLLEQPTAVGHFGDIRTFHFYWEAARKTVAEYGQLPFWNPWFCGGMVQWADAETSFLAPTFLLALLFGPGVGMRAHFVGHFIAGFIGCFVLARRQGLKLPWALAPGVVFVFGGNFAERATGHINFMPFLLLPWLSYFWDRARDDVRWAVGCACVISYAGLAGAPYPFVMFMIYVLVLGLWDAGLAAVRAPRQVRAWARPLVVGAAIAALVLLLPAVKTYVVADFMRDYPRHVPEWDFLERWQLWEVFLEPRLERDRKGYAYVFGEYRQYLGLAMIAVPLMTLRLRHHARDYFVLVVLGILMLGVFASYAPYALLQKLPVFGSLRVPARYALLIDLHIGLLFGHMLARGAELARELPWPRLRRGAVAACLLFFGGVAVDLMETNNRQLFGFYHDNPTAAPRDGPFTLVLGQHGWLHFAPQRNEGWLRCEAPNPLRISRHLRTNLPSEVYVGEGAGGARVTEWTPNAVTAAVRLERPSVVVMNMNWHEGWHADGGEVFEWRGLVAARVPAGEGTLRFWYQPPRFWFYLLLSLVGIGGCLALARWGPEIAWLR